MYIFSLCQKTALKELGPESTIGGWSTNIALRHVSDHEYNASRIWTANAEEAVGSPYQFSWIPRVLQVSIGRKNLAA